MYLLLLLLSLIEFSISSSLIYFKLLSYIKSSSIKVVLPHLHKGKTYMIFVPSELPAFGLIIAISLWSTLLFSLIVLKITCLKVTVSLLLPVYLELIEMLN